MTPFGFLKSTNSFKKIVEKTAAKARAAKGREDSVSKTDLRFPSYLVNYRLFSNNPEETGNSLSPKDLPEICKSGRNEFQAIYQNSGVLNVEKQVCDKIYNEEIRSLFTAMGTGFGAEFELQKHVIKNSVIMTDADVDGAHIRTLLF